MILSRGSSTGGLGNRPESTQHITERQDGSTPPPVTKFGLKWADELLCKEGVYVRRWVIETPWFSVRLHHWLHSDDERALHDHTWWFLTLVLKGKYLDVTEGGSEEMKAGMLRLRPAHHLHMVKIEPGKDCWTLLLTGPIVREFGFLIGGKWRKANRYFFDHGKHVCR